MNADAMCIEYFCTSSSCLELTFGKSTQSLRSLFLNCWMCGLIVEHLHFKSIIELRQHIVNYFARYLTQIPQPFSCSCLDELIDCENVVLQQLRQNWENCVSLCKCLDVLHGQKQSRIFVISEDNMCLIKHHICANSLDLNKYLHAVPEAIARSFLLDQNLFSRINKEFDLF
jgi:hypothetical protein